MNKQTEWNKELLQRLLGEQRAELEAEVAKLQRQLAMRSESEGSALQRMKESVSAEAMAKAKEERIELLRRQVVRRIANRDLALGWSAWHALWEAKSYALGRLREVGNHLRAPEIAGAFGFWSGPQSRTHGAHSSSQRACRAHSPLKLPMPCARGAGRGGGEISRWPPSRRSSLRRMRSTRCAAGRSAKLQNDRHRRRHRRRRLVRSTVLRSPDGALARGAPPRSRAGARDSDR